MFKSEPSGALQSVFVVEMGQPCPAVNRQSRSTFLNNKVYGG